MGLSTIALTGALSRADGRAAAAQALAEHLGAKCLLFFLRDPKLGVMLPAPGMTKTVAGGPLWRAFIRRCNEDGRVLGEVDWPRGGHFQAVGIVVDGVAAILVGGQPGEDKLLELEQQMPLLAALLHAEQAMLIGAAEAAEARDAALRARTLADALDRSRAASARLNQQLRQEHERKDEFLAMLGHELRNPLAPLVNSVEILRREGNCSVLAKRQHELMARQLQHLTRLVDDLVDVSRVSRGSIQLRRSVFPLSAVLADAIEDARPAIEARRHVVQLTGIDHRIFINGDRVRLTQVFSNLLLNGAKYTHPGGLLTINMVCDMGRVSVVVRDNGIGIAQHLLSQIFEVFAQGPVTLDRSQGGLGLGLTLARTLVELHGGRVSAHSDGPGQGSTFTVTLPLVDCQLPDAACDTDGDQTPELAPRVLVVDDNQDAANTLGEMLSLMGASVTLAHDGAQALGLVGDVAPGLVLLDIGLPGMDGFEVARRMRLLPDLHARLVAVTGYGSGEDRQRSRAAGFDEHLVKPVSPAVIRELLAGSPMHTVS